VGLALRVHIRSQPPWFVLNVSFFSSYRDSLRSFRVCAINVDVGLPLGPPFLFLLTRFLFFGYTGNDMRARILSWIIWATTNSCAQYICLFVGSKYSYSGLQIVLYSPLTCQYVVGYQPLPFDPQCRPLSISRRASLLPLNRCAHSLPSPHLGVEFCGRS